MKDNTEAIENLSESVKTLRFLRKYSGADQPKGSSSKTAIVKNDEEHWILPEYVDTKANQEDKALALVRNSFGGIDEKYIPDKYKPIIVDGGEKGLSKVDYKWLVGGYPIYDSESIPAPPIRYPARMVYNRNEKAQTTAGARYRSINAINTRIRTYQQKLRAVSNK